MIDLDFNKKCYGCSACKNICPKNAISMIYDKYGFLVPHIDKEKCVNCKMCEKVCPRLVDNNDDNNVNPLNCMFIYKKKIDSDLQSSTSSGICFEFAKYILSTGGYVCGCIFNNMKVEHVVTNDFNIIEKMKGTKYVQSDIQYIYEDVKRILDSGKNIVFFGMGCQIKGLKNFLKKDYRNIFYIQIICHSIPSPKVFEKYKTSVEKKYNKKLVDINFRYKGKGGWLTPNTMYYFEDGSNVGITSDPYYVGFGKGLFDRNCCISCQMKNNFEIADIILGDAWGIDSIEFLKSKNKGASSIIINSKKGEELFNKVSHLYNQKNIDLKTISKENPAIVKKCEFNKNRDEIIDKILKNEEFPSEELLGKKHKLKNILSKMGILSFLKKIKYIIKHR